MLFNRFAVLVLLSMYVVSLYSPITQHTHGAWLNGFAVLQKGFESFIWLGLTAGLGFIFNSLGANALWLSWFANILFIVAMLRLWLETYSNQFGKAYGLGTSLIFLSIIPFLWVGKTITSWDTTLIVRLQFGGLLWIATMILTGLTLLNPSLRRWSNLKLAEQIGLLPKLSGFSNPTTKTDEVTRPFTIQAWTPIKAFTLTKIIPSSKKLFKFLDTTKVEVNLRAFHWILIGLFLAFGLFMLSMTDFFKFILISIGIAA